MRHFVFCSLALAPTLVPADPVDTLVSDFMRFAGAQGAAVAIVRDGKVVKSRGYGLANVEAGSKVSAKTPFKIASVSKQFIATAVMLLQQDGKLRVDDRASQYLPETPESWKDITLRHLLSHTSGLVRESPGFQWHLEQSDLAVIKAAYDTPLDHPTGTRYQYCNLGYFMLAEIVTKVSGLPWQEFLRQRVFEPLGMHSTRATTASGIVPGRAMGYEWRRGALSNALHYVAVRPSGAFLSSADDLAKWELALQDDKVLSKESKLAMWTPTALADGRLSPYGFGWSLSQRNGHVEVSHNGALPGFRSHFSRYVDDRLAVIVLINDGGAQAEMLGDRIAGLLVKGLSKPPWKPAVNPDLGKEGWVADYVRGLQSPSPPTKSVTAAFADNLDWATLRARTQGFGPLRRVVSLEATGLTGPYSHRYLLEFARLKVVAELGFVDGKIDRFAVSLP